jgi:hypothetical protein
MALTYVGGNSNTGTGATIAVSLTALTGGSNSSPSAGDLVVVFFGLGASGNWTATLSEQSGNYTHFGTQSRGNDTRDAVCRGAYRIQPGTPDTSVTVSGPNNTAYSGWAAVQVWRGVNSATPLTGTASGTGATDSNHADAAAITPGANNAVVIFGFAGTAAAGTADSKTLPTGYTTYAINTISTIGSGAECYYGVAAKLLSGGSGVSEDPGALSGGTTSTSDGWATWTAALNPAPASQTCTEVSTLGDVLTVKLTSRTVKETLTLTDPTVTTKQQPWKQSLTEVAVLSHSTLKLAGIILFEGVTLLDPTITTQKTSPGNNYTTTPVEMAVLADTLRVVKGTQQATETLALGATLRAVPTSKQLTESATLLTDSARKDVGRTLIQSGAFDSFQLTASARKDVGRVLTEGLTLTDPAVTTQKTGGVNNYTKDLTETALLIDTATKDVGRVLANTSVLVSDAVQKGAGRALTEGLTLTDSVRKDAGKLIIHEGSGSGSYPAGVQSVAKVTKDVGRILTEGVGLTDTVRKLQGEIRLSEAVVLHDGTLRVTDITFDQPTTLTDPTITTQKTGGGATNYTKDLTETATLIDTLTKGESRTLAETATLADTVSKGEGRALAEGVTLTATPTKGDGRAVAEVVSLTDTVRAPKGTQQLSDVATLTDTVRAQKAVQQLSELVSLTDPVVETQKTSGGGTAYTKSLTETAALVDTLRAVAGTKQLAELAVLTDTVRPQKSKQQATELVSLTDTPTKSPSRTFATEALTLTATPTKGAGKQVTTQVATLTDTLRARAGTQQATELVTLLDTLRARAGTKQATETVVLVATPTKATARTLTEGLTLTDPTVTTQKGVIVSSYSVTLTEGVVLSVGYLHVTALVITEELGLSTELTANRLVSKQLADGVTLSASMGPRAISRTLVETAGLSTSLNVPLRLLDGAVLVDEVTLGLGHNRSNFQTVRLTDTITTVRTRKEANPTEGVTLTATLTVDRPTTGRTLTEMVHLNSTVAAPDFYKDQEVLTFAE